VCVYVQVSRWRDINATIQLHLAIHYHTSLHACTITPPLPRHSVTQISLPMLKTFYPLTYSWDPRCEGISVWNQQRTPLYPTRGEAGASWVDWGTILWGILLWVRINDETCTAKLLGQLRLGWVGGWGEGIPHNVTDMARGEGTYSARIQSYDLSHKITTYCSFVWIKCLGSAYNLSCLTVFHSTVITHLPYPLGRYCHIWQCRCIHLAPS